MLVARTKGERSPNKGGQGRAYCSHPLPAHLVSARTHGLPTTAQGAQCSSSDTSRRGHGAGVLEGYHGAGKKVRREREHIKRVALLSYRQGKGARKALAARIGAHEEATVGGRRGHTDDTPSQSPRCNRRNHRPAMSEGKERERECVCVFVYEREREKDRKEKERERDEGRERQNLELNKTGFFLLLIISKPHDSFLPPSL